PRPGRAIAVPERVQRSRAEERPPPSTTTQLRTVLVVLRELAIDVRDRRERDGLRRVDLPDRRASHADLLLAGRTVAQRLAQAAGVDALEVRERVRDPLARKVAHLHGLLEDRVDGHGLDVTEREV